MDKIYDTIIIGGGAAGLMAGYSSAAYGKNTLIIERNKGCGAKLLITGKGRCNVTNNCDLDEFLKNVPTNSRFLYSAYSNFTSSDCIDFFERAGVPLKTERGNRVFPVSDKAVDIVSALVRTCKDFGVSFFNGRVSEILHEDGAVTGVLCDDGTKISAKSVLIATGGKSYPKTGSTGDGYLLAKSLGHSVTKIKPSLVPVVSPNKFCAELMGLSLKNVTLSLHDLDKNSVVFSELGEMLFTHFGVSGPLVLSASCHIKDIDKKRYKFTIDFKPALDEKKLDERILRDFLEIPNRIFANSISKLLPSKLIPVVIKLSGISPDKQVNSVTKKEREGLVNLLKNFPIEISSFRPIDEAIVTSGGVSVKEVSPKTMESKLISGLYFAGEVLDLDAYTGGFNLQIAFATGYLAGQNM